MSKIKMPIEKSHIMMFARSIGDANPKYYEEKDENVIAPPTFIQSSAQYDPDYFLRPKIGGDNWFGSGKEATGMKSSGSGSGGTYVSSVRDASTVVLLFVSFVSANLFSADSASD